MRGGPARSWRRRSRRSWRGQPRGDIVRKRPDARQAVKVEVRAGDVDAVTPLELGQQHGPAERVKSDAIAQQRGVERRAERPAVPGQLSEQPPQLAGQLAGHCRTQLGSSGSAWARSLT